MNNGIRKLITLKDGFSLVELAIVLVIVGVLIGMGAGLIGPLTKRAKYNETKDIINAAIESVISYGAANNKLPDTGTFSSAIRNPNDAWQKSLYYILDNNLTNTLVGGICGRKSTKLAIDICPDTGCGSPSTTISNVAFIILSGDGNYNNQTAGTQAVTSSTTINVYELDVNVDNYAGDMNRAEPYDDIVQWVTIDELRIKAGCTGAQLRIVNNELPYGFKGSTYNATIYGDGGVPFSSGGDYRWCRQESASTGLTFTPSTLSSDCLNLSESSWGQADELTISGTPISAGSFNFTFFVRDYNDSSGNNDNIAQKTIVLTINPSILTAGCADYRVWNNTFGSRRDFRIDGSCKTVVRDAEVTTPEMLNNGETIERNTSFWGSCSGFQTNFTFNQAVAADNNGDCCVNFNGTDKTCP
jgi:prepilin-type N-terminal cleavage/methylation domain-containing protein